MRLLSLLSVVALSAAVLPPNIIHIVVDDLGYYDLGYKNNITVSPNIDKLANQGVKLTKYYTFMICAPSRASIQTGRYPWRIGYYDMEADQAVNVSFAMTPAVLKKADYTTVAIGKWDLGESLVEYTATRRGFDYFFGYYKAATESYWYHGAHLCGFNDRGTDFSNNTVNEIGGALGQNGTYTTYSFTDFAIDRINKQDKTKPLYMYLAYQATHAAGLQGIQAEYEVVEDHYKLVKNDSQKVMAACVTILDGGIGNITKALVNNNMWDNTVIILTTDNGGPLDHTFNYPLRGGKHTFWEGGLNGEAFIFSELIPQSARGTEWDGLMHSSDLYPTIIEGIAGMTMPSNTGPMPVDGFNMWELIKQSGSPKAVSPRTEIISQVHNQYFNTSIKNYPAVIRSGVWKFISGGPAGDSVVLEMPPLQPNPVPYGLTGGIIENGTNHCTVLSPYKPSNTTHCRDSPCLFNLQNDPQEKVNLADDPKYADIVSSLTKRLSEEGAKAMPQAFAWPAGPARHNGEMKMCQILNQTGFVEPADWTPNN
eukprot:TRINITY_DN27668_c0_g1_i1.p1 TRINITY_DN27668_c0_g1~~TRINITY_DN27668_c0_g1_i1.p1  ORF type:complete len:554 (+),score=113.26 TRINITY_DN27668_c0_g1_i1:49-1662(+)